MKFFYIHYFTFLNIYYYIDNNIINEQTTPIYETNINVKRAAYATPPNTKSNKRDPKRIYVENINIQNNSQSKKLPTSPWNNSTNIYSKRQNNIITKDYEYVKDKEQISQKFNTTSKKNNNYTSIEFETEMKTNNILQTNIDPVTITDTFMNTKSKKQILHQTQKNMAKYIMSSDEKTDLKKQEATRKKEFRKNIF